MKEKENILSNINNSRASYWSTKEQEINDELDYAELVSDSFNRRMITNQSTWWIKTNWRGSLKRLLWELYGICDMCGINIPLGKIKKQKTICKILYRM